MIMDWRVCTTAEADAMMALNDNTAGVNPRLIDNSAADDLGFGVLLGKKVTPKRLETLPLYSRWHATLLDQQAITADTDALFLPTEE